MVKKTLHRSENLVISHLVDQESLEFEIRFSSSIARGTCEARCPRCGMTGAPSDWELKGPDDLGNTVWLNCVEDQGCPGNAEGSFRWTQNVGFPEGWVERGE